VADVVKLGSSATTPADLLGTMSADADRMRAVVVVALMDDGSWHVEF